MKSSHSSGFTSDSTPEDDVLKVRWANLLRTTNAGSFGCLYRVYEDIWKKTLPATYDQGNTRVDHPGCSIRAENSSLSVYVPMLHGSSSKPKYTQSVVISYIYGDPHKTYFGGLDPVPIPITKKKQVEVAEKGHVTSDEERALRNLCQQRKWL